MSASLLDQYPMTPVQHDAVTARGQDVAVTAGAGSGKTRTLVARYLSLLEEGFAPRSVVAITFTEKAAREMRNRIRAEVSTWLRGGCPVEARGRWAEIEADIDTARIGTIHSLCASILRAHPAEAGVDPRFGVVEEGLADAWKSQAVEDALTWAAGQSDLASLVAGFTPMGLAGILSRLMDFRLDARQAFDRNDSPRLWDRALGASVGGYTGHPEVRRSIAALAALSHGGGLGEDAGEKLAHQVEGLLAAWPAVTQALEAGEAQRAAVAVVAMRARLFDARAGRRSGQAWKCMRTLREVYDETLGPVLGKTEEELAAALERNENLTRLLPLLRRLFERAEHKYQRTKDRGQALDFDDLEQTAVQVLALPAVRDRWRREIAAVLVDEFQDTNARQRQIIEALSGVADAMHGRLFVVGDAKQSIYRFRGADVEVFLQLNEFLQEHGALSLRLVRTFRAHGALVKILNDLLPKVMRSGSNLETYRVPYEPLEADRAEPRGGILSPYLEFVLGVAASAEEGRLLAAKLLAARLHEVRASEGVAWEDIALLFRASTGFAAYESALEAAGIPFITVAGRGFYDRPEVRDLLNLLRALANPWDNLALAGLLRSPAFALSDAALYQLRWPQGAQNPVDLLTALAGSLQGLERTDRLQAERAHRLIAELGSMVGRLPVDELLKEVLDRTLYLAVLGSASQGDRLRRNVDKLLDDAHTSGIVRVEDFLEYVESLHASGAREGEAPAEVAGSVRLMTVHKAKGLEFPIVVIADAARQPRGERENVLLVPELGVTACPPQRDEEPLAHRLARAGNSARQEAEEIRLLYVAATRAREKLIVCGHQTSRGGNNWLTQLAGAAGIDLLEAAASGAGHLSVCLPSSGEAVSLRLAREAAGRAGPAEASPTNRLSASTAGRILMQPLPRRALEQADDRLRSQEEPIHTRGRGFGRFRRPDGTVVGTLVHEAIRRWRFPGDPRLDRLLQAAGLSEGIVEARELEATLAEAQDQLSRLRSDPRFPEMDVASRQHEVPFSILLGSGLVSGYIDLLYRNAYGRWQVVDFKTTPVSGEAQMHQLIESDYGPQVRRYGEAVAAGLGVMAEAWLCFLNYEGGVHWEMVEWQGAGAAR